MDYSKLRAAALASTEDEEAVTVDTRALIDKVLARYSGEWTTLRELIQNAADAAASTVKIKWETHPSTTVPLPSSATATSSDILKHTLTHHTLRRLLVSNDGQAFSGKDWARLKRIAEGNPDETKIGAFGVGFYSVFADCEEPFVSSGDQAMAFYWKGNALFTRKMQIPAGENPKGETTFVLDYRNTTTALPNLLSVAQFLATSLTFVALCKIEFWIDGWQILALEKKASPPARVPIPQGLQTKTHDGLMQIVAVERMSTQIDAKSISAVSWKPTAAAAKSNESYALGGGDNISSLKSFFSRFSSSGAAAAKAAKEEKATQEAIAEDLLVDSRSSIFLRVTTATIQTSVSASFAAELERATKKPPPKTTRMSILTSSYDDTLASESTSGGAKATNAADVFASVLPSKKPGGRVFIGFPTTQTTGAGMHISAPSVIPTVEREAIDLNARWVKTWNIEMLRVGGIISRLSFQNDMLELDDKIRRFLPTGGKPPPADIAKFMPEALHIMKTYTFGDSTPSGHVGQIIQEASWMAYRKATIEVYSSRGVLLSDKVRLRSEKLSKFVSDIPVIPEEMEGNPFVNRLVELGLIDEITVGDVRKELESKSLSKDQVIHFLTWLAGCSLTGEIDPAGRQSLLDVAVATIGDEKSQDAGAVIALSTVETFLSSNKIHQGLPLPPTTIPYSLTAGIPVPHLQALGWRTLELVPWLTFLVDGASRGSLPDEHNMTKSAAFATQVLEVLSKNWDTISASHKNVVVDTLTKRAIMPTKMGLKKPGESFFPTVKLFDDLPVVTGSNKLKEKFLLALGVRKTLDLNTIFSRLLSPDNNSEKGGAPKWSHVELVKYLASVRDDIPRTDMERLRTSRICPAEAGPKGMESTKPSSKLYQVNELYEPLEALRALGLPILQWPGPPGSYRGSSPEARFLAALGLRPHPTVIKLVEMMAQTDDDTKRSRAMTYFISQHHINGYASVQLGRSTLKFLPLLNNPKKLVAPSACYTNEDCAILGFDILSRELHQHANKFGVARDPPIIDCVNRLIASPPRTPEDARKPFEYFASRISELGGNSLAKLRDAAIVPVRREKAGVDVGIRFLRPQNCYLGKSTTYGEIFDFVDFGSDANTFLYKCGSQAEPSTSEIAHLACKEPARLFSALQSPERYLNLLRSLAETMPTLKKDKDLFRKMQTAPFLLGFREIAPPSSTKEKSGPLISYAEDDEDAAPIKQYQLASASQIVVLDDFISYRLFKDALMVAPEEDALETFYIALGVPLLSSLIREDIKIGSLSDKQDRAEAFRRHVVERAKIFLHEWQRSSKYDVIRHDAKWLEKNLRVEMVRSLALRRTLVSINGRASGSAKAHTEKRSAATNEKAGGTVLYVSAEDKVDMYQVGQALCHLLLARPNQQAYFFLEPFLNLGLLDLKARGYNVDRILNIKRQEARVAEEARAKALEREKEERRAREATMEEQRAREERDAGKKALAGLPPVPQNRPITPPKKSGKMPGSFGDESPDDKVKALPLPPRPGSSGSDTNKRGRGLFSNIRRNLGLRSSSDSPSPSRDGTASGTLQNTVSPSHPPSTGAVTPASAIANDLTSAIRATRPHGSHSLFTPPSSTSVPAQSTYCDSASGQDLALATSAPSGTAVYIDRASLASASEVDAFVAVQQPNIALFERVLAEVAAVYGVPMGSVHIFWDRVGSTIAFNLNGSIFANLRFFNQLHSGALMRGGNGVGGAWGEACVWWWVTLAHELAHNLEGQHGAQHSYYTESFIQQFFDKMMARCAAFSTGAVAGRPALGSAEPQQQEAGPPPPYQTRPAM